MLENIHYSNDLIELLDEFYKKDLMIKNPNLLIFKILSDSSFKDSFGFNKDILSYLIPIIINFADLKDLLNLRLTCKGLDLCILPYLMNYRKFNGSILKFNGGNLSPFSFMNNLEIYDFYDVNPVNPLNPLKTMRIHNLSYITKEEKFYSNEILDIRKLSKKIDKVKFYHYLPCFKIYLPEVKILKLTELYNNLISKEIPKDHNNNDNIKNDDNFMIHVENVEFLIFNGKLKNLYSIIKKSNFNGLKTCHFECSSFSGFYDHNYKYLPDSVEKLIIKQTRSPKTRKETLKIDMKNLKHFELILKYKTILKIDIKQVLKKLIIKMDNINHNNMNFLTNHINFVKHLELKNNSNIDKTVFLFLNPLKINNHKLIKNDKNNHNKTKNNEDVFYLQFHSMNNNISLCISKNLSYDKLEIIHFEESSTEMTKVWENLSLLIYPILNNLINNSFIKNENIAIKLEDDLSIFDENNHKYFIKTNNAKVNMNSFLNSLKINWLPSNFLELIHQSNNHNFYSNKNVFINYQDHLILDILFDLFNNETRYELWKNYSNGNKGKMEKIFIFIKNLFWKVLIPTKNKLSNLFNSNQDIGNNNHNFNHNDNKLKIDLIENDDLMKINFVNNFMIKNIINFFSSDNFIFMLKKRNFEIVNNDKNDNDNKDDEKDKNMIEFLLYYFCHFYDNSDNFNDGMFIDAKIAIKKFLKHNYDKNFRCNYAKVFFDIFMNISEKMDKKQITKSHFIYELIPLMIKNDFKCFKKFWTQYYDNSIKENFDKLEVTNENLKFILSLNELESKTTLMEIFYFVLKYKNLSLIEKVLIILLSIIKDIHISEEFYREFYHHNYYDIKVSDFKLIINIFEIFFIKLSRKFSFLPQSDKKFLNKLYYICTLKLIE